MPPEAEGQRAPLRKNQALLLGAYAARILTALVVTMIVGSSLCPEDFGFFLLVGTIFALATIVLDLGTEGLAVRAVAQAPDRERACLEALMAWRLFAGLACGAATVVLAIFETDALRRQVLLATAVVLSLMAPSALGAVFSMRQRQTAPALVGMVNQLLTIIATLWLLKVEAPGAAFGLVVVGRELLSLLCIWWLATRLTRYSTFPRWSRSASSLGFRTAGIMGAAVLAKALYFHADVFLVRFFRGEAELGAYAAALRPVNTLLVLPSIFTIPLLPILSSLAAKDRAGLGRLMLKATAALTALGAVGLVIGAGLAPTLLGFLYGGRYTDGTLSAVPALRWLCGAFFSVCATSALTMTLVAEGRVSVLLRLGLLGLVLNVGLNALLLPRLGFTAAGLVTALTETAVLLGAAVACWPLARAALDVRRKAKSDPKLALTSESMHAGNHHHRG